MKIARTHLLARLALAAAVSVGLAACGGSSNNTEDEETDSGPTLEERQTSQQTAITAAATGVTTALTGLNSTSPTQGQVDALDMAIAALDAAIKAAEDLSDSAKSGASGTLTFAQTASTTAKANIAAAAKATRAATQQKAIDDALAAVMKAEGDLDAASEPSQDLVDALESANDALESAIGAADDVDAAKVATAQDELDDAEGVASTAQDQVTTALNNRRADQSRVIATASARLLSAREDLKEAGDSPTSELVARLQAAITRLDDAVKAAADWDADEKPITDARSAISGARSELIAARDEVDSDNEDLMNAQKGAIKTATTALGNALDALSTPPTSDQIAALARAIEGLDAAVKGASDLDPESSDVTTANTLLKAARTQHARAQEDYNDAEAAKALAQRKTNNAAALKVDDAIRKHDVSDAPPAELVALENPSAGTTNFAVSRTTGEAKFTLTQTTAAARSKPYTMSSAPSLGSGWMGKTFTHTDSKDRRPFTETAVVYTDIEESGDAPWASATFPSVSAVADGTATFDSSANDAASRFTGILPSKPDAGDPDNVQDYTARADISALAITGTFYGVSGVYRCALDATCTVRRSATDRVTITGFTFDPTPATSGLMAKNARADTDYTHFGYWTKETSKGGEISHDIETFHRGGGSITPAELSSVVGTATYSGAAAGVFVKKVGAGDALEVREGAFTADADLEASFGGNDIAVNDQFMISGTISGFTDDEGVDLEFDELALEGADFQADGSTSTSTFSGKTNGGGASGKWTGTFFGDVDSADTDGSDTNADNFPENVSGEFNGNFVNGSRVVGAFGAEYE